MVRSKKSYFWVLHWRINVCHILHTTKPTPICLCAGRWGNKCLLIFRIIILTHKYISTWKGSFKQWTDFFYISWRFLKLLLNFILLIFRNIIVNWKWQLRLLRIRRIFLGVLTIKTIDSSDTTIYLLAFPQMVCATTRPVIVLIVDLRWSKNENKPG